MEPFCDDLETARIWLLTHGWHAEAAPTREGLPVWIHYGTTRRVVLETRSDGVYILVAEEN